mgnify:CR=1 FL=1
MQGKCSQTLGQWIFWLLGIMIAVTCVWSMNYLQKAMMVFGNTEVVPVYYCTFTLASIVGGGVSRESACAATHASRASSHASSAESAL